MKPTPKSVARAVGNRKLNFALIERQRSNATKTLRHEMSRYVTRDSQRQILPAADDDTKILPLQHNAER